MNNYRENATQFKKETRWTFWKFLPIFITFIIVISGLFFGLRSIGLIGSTIVERQVFENSFQYKTGMAQRAAVLEANIAEIDSLLMSNPDNKQELLNQKSVLKVQLRAITINQ